MQTIVPVLRRVEQIMGLPVIVDVRDEEVDAAAIDQVFAWFTWVDETFSTYKPSSEVCRIDRGELELRDAHPDVLSVLARCERLRTETDGFFDARASVTGALDPSALVKGWSVDRAAALLDAEGARNYAIYAGGDVRLRGGALPSRHWKVGIQHPRERDRVAGIVETSDLAIATSGAYERGDHVFDPHTGQPPDGVLSVTVTGPDVATADAFSTAAFAMGVRGPAWTAALDGYEAMTILEDRRVLLTDGFPLAPPEELEP